ncbi:MAG: Clp protease/crotonase-like domain-containing protein [Planctomycetota bacterium]|jgi:hypothetical protein
MMSRVRIAIVVLTLGLVFGGVGVLVPESAPRAEASWQDETLDRIYLKNGRIVEGRIISETATEVEMEVIVAGISAPTTFQKTDIIEIKRGTPATDGDAPASAPETRSSTSSPRNASTPKIEVPEGAKKVFHIKLSGHLMGDPFGGIPYLFNAGRRDVLSYTPIEEVIGEAVDERSDVIVVELSLDSPGGYEGLSVARTLQPIFEDAEREGARIVFWVERAAAGAAFLAFMSEEIYFKPDGLMGGVGGIEDFQLGGDSVVDEKQISLRIGRAEGLAIQHGYDPVLVRAMMRKDVVLYVRFRGGKAEYLDHVPRISDGDGWELLTDDGEGDNEDEWSFEGNDYLNLDAPLAQRLGVSDGTASTIDDLVYELDLGRDYAVVRGKSGRVLSDWQGKIARAADQILDIFVDLGLEDFSSWSPTGQTTQDLGRQLRGIQRARSLVTRHAEVFDPAGDYTAQLDLMIEQVRAAVRDANEQENRRGGRRQRR